MALVQWLYCFLSDIKEILKKKACQRFMMFILYYYIDSLISKQVKGEGVCVRACVRVLSERDLLD